MAHHRKPCDSYFVESHESSYQRPSHDYLKMLGLRKREAMANELSRQACDTYMEDIVNHMKQMEDETLADVASIDIQQEIQWFMRPYLIDFLIEAHAAFQLLPETLFLAVNLLDRYCSRRVVYKRHYQLVGCAALLIAAKYGDKKERVPMIRELKSMCCNLYDEDMFTQMEWHVLNTLEWVIGHPTVDTWLQLELTSGPIYEDARVEHMALYLAEIALYHKEFVSKRSSVMARAALTLTRGLLGRSENLDTQDLEVSQTLVELGHKLDRTSQVLSRKYASPHMSSVSITVEKILLEQEQLNRRAAAAAPPTPPAEVTLSHRVTPDMFPGTPQKPYGNGNVVNGYMTPPITPDGECFAGANETKGYHQLPPRCPVTPTPQMNPYTHQQYQHYQNDVGMGMH